MKVYIVEKDFKFHNMRCVVIFNKHGYRCGYVGVNKDNKYYGKDYMNEELDNDLCGGNCHGGITYSSGGEKSSFPVESDLWWFGFDCAHAWDGRDYELARQYFPELDIPSPHPLSRLNDNPKSLDFVVAECKKLAKQLRKGRRYYGENLRDND